MRPLPADAHSLGAAGEGRARERVEGVRHGHGRSATAEWRRTRLVGVKALTTDDTYGDAAYARQRQRTDFDGHPLNAVVVLR